LAAQPDPLHAGPGSLERHAGTRSPYERKGMDLSKNKIALRVGVYYVLGLVAILAGLVWVGEPFWLGLGAGLAWAAVMAFYAVIPANWYSQYRVHPTYSMRVITLMRITFTTLVATAVAFLALRYGRFAFYYAVLLWLVPIVTSFSLFMMLRQVVQHSNGDRGWMTNTRVFLVNLLVRDSILPYGQDYHVPHHMFATVPHYRLKELHRLLMECPEYRDEVIEVCGAIVSKDHDHPCIIDVLGPDYALGGHTAHIDDTVLEDNKIEEREEILKEGRESAGL
jgi:fatty acid desaturase